MRIKNDRTIIVIIGLILFLPLMFIVIFPIEQYFDALLIPPVYQRYLWVFDLLYLLCLFLFFIVPFLLLGKRWSLKPPYIVISLLLLINTLVLPGFLLGIGIGRHPGDWRTIDIPGSQKTYAIYRFSGIPEGENFRLYEIREEIYKEEVAHSYRWHEAYKEYDVGLFHIATPRRLENPDFIYHVETNTIEILTEGLL